MWVTIVIWAGPSSQMTGETALKLVESRGLSDIVGKRVPHCVSGVVQGALIGGCSIGRDSKTKRRGA